MPLWTWRGWTLGDAISRRVDRRLLRRAQSTLAPVLRDGEVVVAFDPATVEPSGSCEPVIAEGTFVTLYLTNLALYVLDDGGATLRISRDDFTVTESTSRDRLDLELSGGRRLAATPAPAPSRVALQLVPAEET